MGRETFKRRFNRNYHELSDWLDERWMSLENAATRNGNGMGVTTHFALVLVALQVVISIYYLGCACLLYTSPSPRDATLSRMPSSA